jgi:tetratricopeptide (TPR) repeat protein
MRFLTVAKKIFLGLVLTSACSDKTATELAREKADPRAVKYLIQAEDAFRLGAYNSALVLADSAKGIEPKLADIHYIYGAICNKTRRFDEAVKAFEEVIALDPNYQGVWFNLGNIAYQKNDITRALRFYRRENSVDEKADVHYSIGRCFEKTTQPDSAMAAYKKTLELNDKHSMAYLRLGELYSEAGELDKAVEFSEKGLSFEPENLDFQYAFASILMLKGESGRALPYFQNVANAIPWHYWAHFNLGQSLVRVGRKAEGERYLAMADSLEAINREIEKWRILVEENPDQLGLWVNFGNALRLGRRFEESIEAHKMAIYLDPNRPALYNNLANLFLLVNDTTNAEALYREILKRDSTMSDVWLNLGVVFAQKGDKEAAIKAWKTALQLNPRDSTAMGYLDEIQK